MTKDQLSEALRGLLRQAEADAGRAGIDVMDADAIERWREAWKGQNGHDMAPINYNSLRRLIALIDWLARDQILSALSTKGADVDWHPRDEPAPEGFPVLAEHRAWNSPAGELMQHVVWWFDGEWRVYPDTDGRAYVDRWKYLPAARQAVDVVEVQKIETVTGNFYTEPGEPFWRIEIDGYCADFEHEPAARNFADAINRRQAVDVETAKAAILKDLRDRRLLKWLFAEDADQNPVAIGYVDGPIDSRTQDEIAEALARAAIATLSGETK